MFDYFTIILIIYFKLLLKITFMVNKLSYFFFKYKIFLIKLYIK